MTTVLISGAANTVSSPWIDYANDTAYVGTDDGKLYKIFPVFGGGAPALVSNADWPVKVVTSGASNVLTDPVVDNTANRLFIGDGNGYLYAVSLANPAKATAARLTIGWVGHGPGTGIVDPPIVVKDSANPAQDQVFAFAGCSNVVGIGGAVNQVAANFTSASAFTTVDLGSSDGSGNCTTRDVHAGTFDNQFWINGTTGGHMVACGFVSAGGAPSKPKMYMFPFTAGHLITSTGSTSWTINNSLPVDGILQRNHGSYVFRGGRGRHRRFHREFDLDRFRLDAELRQPPQHFLRHRSHRTGRNQRYRGRQSANQWRN
jgi:hypothetical protein